MKLYFLSVAAGKRLIGRAVAAHPAVREALRSGTVAVIAGTTNGCAAEEILASIGQSEGFSKRRFFRGVSTPPQKSTDGQGRLPDDGFPGDVIIERGTWIKGKTIFDSVDSLAEGDVILKGANAWNTAGQAAILIGHPKGGTIGAALQAVVGRRVRLLMPAGYEKCIPGDLFSVAARLNAPGAEGSRLLPVPGTVISETDAIRILTGAEAFPAAAGGVFGGEGGTWFAVDGTPGQAEQAEALLKSVASEPPFGC